MNDPVTRIVVDFKQMKAFAEDPFIIERAQDVYVYDQQGKQYIDGLAGVFVVSVGHSNASVMEAIVDQMQRLTFAPPLASATTGFPLASASIMAIPKSSSPGTINARHLAYKSRSSASVTRPQNSTLGPACFFNDLYSGP